MNFWSTCGNGISFWCFYLTKSITAFPLWEADTWMSPWQCSSNPLVIYQLQRILPTKYILNLLISLYYFFIYSHSSSELFPGLMQSHQNCFLYFTLVLFHTALSAAIWGIFYINLRGFRVDRLVNRSWSQGHTGSSPALCSVLGVETVSDSCSAPALPPPLMKKKIQIWSYQLLK